MPGLKFTTVRRVLPLHVSYLLQRACMRERSTERVERGGGGRRRQAQRRQRARVQLGAHDARVEVHHHQAGAAAELHYRLVCRYLEGPVLCLSLYKI